MTGMPIEKNVLKKISDHSYLGTQEKYERILQKIKLMQKNEPKFGMAQRKNK